MYCSLQSQIHHRSHICVRTGTITKNSSQNEKGMKALTHKVRLNELEVVSIVPWSCCYKAGIVSASGAGNPQRGICRAVKGALQRRKWAERSCLHIKEKSLLEWKLLGSRITSPGRQWSLWPHYRGHKAWPDGPVPQYATGRASPWASWRKGGEGRRSVSPSLGVYGLSFVLAWILKQHTPAPRIWRQG